MVFILGGLGIWWIIVKVYILVVYGFIGVGVFLKVVGLNLEVI